MTIAVRSGQRPVLQAAARHAAACAGLAGLALIGGPAVTAAAFATAPAAPAQQAAGLVATGRAPQLAAGAQFVHSPRAVPASAGATQVCPVPSRPGQMTCMALVPSRARATADAGPPAGAYAPADLLSAYGLASAAASIPGGTATVAIVDAFNDRRAAHDLAVYRAHYGLPRCTVGGAARCLRIVNASGGSRLPRTDRSGDWEFEESVDLDMVSAICPLCHILLVEATSDSISSLAAAEGYASRHANVVSNSWGSGAEFTGENAFDGRFNHPGVAIVAAGGDAGYGTQYPAASQFVTAVGGSTLTGATPDSSGSQLAWSGTGSGCSSLEPKPAWQQDATPSACQNRTDTDVAADADPHTPVAIYDSAGSNVPGIATGWNAAGGTERGDPDHRRRLCTGGRAGGRHLSRVLPLPAPRRLHRRDFGLEWRVRSCPAVLVHGPGWLRRPDWSRHAQRPWWLRRDGGRGERH